MDVSLIGILLLLLLGGGSSMTLLMLLGVIAVSLFGFAMPTSTP